MHGDRAVVAGVSGAVELRVVVVAAARCLRGALAVPQPAPALPRVGGRARVPVRHHSVAVGGAASAAGPAHALVERTAHAARSEVAVCTVVGARGRRAGVARVALAALRLHARVARAPRVLA